MARGWESKSVESQQSEEERTRRPSGRRALGIDEGRLAALESSRIRLERELTTSSNPRYREYLQTALDDVIRQLGDD